MKPIDYRQAGRITRRQLLGAFGAAAASPYIVPARAMGKEGREPPGERITVGMIGTGNQGMAHVNVLVARGQAQVVAVCDPFAHKRQAARHRVENAYAQLRVDGTFRGCTDYRDFRELVSREDIDAVFIASPEHWHALHAIAAAKAGKDVYVEKALTATIAEGQAMVRTVRRYARVLQVGTQQRSSAQFRLACELARNGYLGRVHTIRVSDPKGYPGPAVRSEPVPQGLDYDLWLGPAPWGPYFPERLENLRGWMLCYDYTVGFMSGWGQHDIDIAQWGNGTDATGPIEVEGRGQIPSQGLNDSVALWHTEFTYANGVRLIFTSDNEMPQGIRFEGPDGWVLVNRSGIWSQPESLARVRLGSNDLRLYESRDHHRDFLDCVKARRDPICPVEVGHHTNVICNLSDIAIRLGRKLRWDPDRERFVNDGQADRMLTRAMRPPWRL